MPHPAPECLSIVLCDQVIEDKRTSKKSLIGVFNEVLVTNFPAKHDCMFLFVTLTNCLGNHDFNIEFSRDAEYDVESIMQIRGQIQGRNPMDIIDLVFELRGLPLPHPGKYQIDVYSAATNQRLAQRYFNVRQIPASQSPPPQNPPNL